MCGETNVKMSAGLIADFTSCCCVISFSNELMPASSGWWLGGTSGRFTLEIGEPIFF